MTLAWSHFAALLSDLQVWKVLAQFVGWSNVPLARLLYALIAIAMQLQEFLVRSWHGQKQDLSQLEQHQTLTLPLDWIIIYDNSLGFPWQLFQSSVVKFWFTQLGNAKLSSENSETQPTNTMIFNQHFGFHTLTLFPFWRGAIWPCQSLRGGNIRWPTWWDESNGWNDDQLVNQAGQSITCSLFTWDF